MDCATLDPHLMQQAVDAVAEQLDVCRIRFNVADGIRQSLVASVGGSPWSWTDLGDDSDPEGKISEAVAQSHGIEDRCLLNVLGFRTQTNDVVVVIAHHLIADGHSLGLVASALADAYRALLSAQPVRIIPTSSWTEWARALPTWAQGEDVANSDAYWRTQERPVTMFAVSDGDASYGTAEVIPCVATQALTQAFRATQGGESLLLAAFSQAVGAVCDCPDVQVRRVVHGRVSTAPQQHLSATVGYFATAHDLVLQVGDVDTAVARVADDLSRVPHDGVSQSARRLDPSDEMPRPSIRFNVLGDLDRRFADLAPFTVDVTRLTVNYAPDRTREAELDVSIMVVNNQLTVLLEHSPQRVTATLVSAIGARMLELLEAWLCKDQT